MDYYQAYDIDIHEGFISKGTASIPGKDDDKKIFVGGISRQTTEIEIKNYFSQFGKVDSVTVKVDPHTGQSRGFAFVVFSDDLSIYKLLDEDHYINKRKVDPKRVVKKVQHGKIFVGGITPDITDDDIKYYFSQYGTVIEIQTPYDKQRNQRKGFCFVTFETKDVAHRMLKYRKQWIKGKEVDVKKVKASPDAYGYPTSDCLRLYYSPEMEYDDYSYDYSDYDYPGYGYGYPPGPPGYSLTSKPKPNTRVFQVYQPY